ncbi:MAG: hypothetical protein ACE5J9_08300 [Methanosarcinales archaeon]
MKNAKKEIANARLAKDFITAELILNTCKNLIEFIRREVAKEFGEERIKKIEYFGP